MEKNCVSTGFSVALTLSFRICMESSFDLIWDSREVILVCAITISFCKYSIWIDSGETCAVLVRLLAGFLDLVVFDCENHA